MSQQKINKRQSGLSFKCERGYRLEQWPLRTSTVGKSDSSGLNLFVVEILSN